MENVGDDEDDEAKRNIILVLVLLFECPKLHDCVAAPFFFKKKVEEVEKPTV